MNAAHPLKEYSGLLQETTTFFVYRIRQNLGVVLLIVFLCVGSAATYWYLQRPYYESELVVSYNNERFTRKTYGEMIEKLNQLAQSGSYNELARQLKLQPDQTKGVLFIEGRNRAGSPLHEDITTEHQDIHVRVRSLDRNVFAPLQGALMDYLSGAPYLVELGKIQVGRLEQKLDYYAADRRQADSLIASYMTSIRNGSIHLDSAGHSGPVDILEYKDQLEEKVISVQHRLEMEKGPTCVLMHGFAPADKPARGSRRMIVGAAIFGLLIGICWAVLRPDKRRLNA